MIKEYDTYVAHLTHIIFNIQNSTFIHNEQDLGVGLNLSLVLNVTQPCHQLLYDGKPPSKHVVCQREQIKIQNKTEIFSSP